MKKKGDQFLMLLFIVLLSLFVFDARLALAVPSMIPFSSVILLLGAKAFMAGGAFFFFLISFVKKRKKVVVFGLLISLGLFLFFAWELRETFDFYDDLKSAQENESKNDQHKEHNYFEVITIKQLGDQREKYFIVDVREKEEFEQGRLKGATNIRLGDIMSDDQFVKKIALDVEEKRALFFCHDGVRSKMAAKVFFEKQGVETFVVEQGFDQFKQNKRHKEQLWEGTIRRVLPKQFSEELDNRKYKLKKIESGLVVDLRTEKKDNVEGISNKEVLHAPIFLMSSVDVEKVVETIGKEKFSAICDSKLSCFFSKILAFRVERQGGEFIGYYLKKNE